MKVDKDRVPLYEKYTCDPEDYGELRIDSKSFSVRAYSRLEKNGIVSVEDLLNTNYKDLKEIQGFGMSCIHEVDKYLRKVVNVVKDANDSDKCCVNDNLGEIGLYRSNIIKEDYSFLNNDDITDDFRSFIDDLKRARDLLGDDIFEKCINDADAVVPIISALKTFAEKNIKKKVFLSQLSFNRKNNKSLYYVKAFTNKKEIKDKIFKDTSEESSLEKLITNIFMQNTRQERCVYDFVEWCKFDLENDINELFDELYSKERNKTVIVGRSSGLTLDKIGNEIGVSRERVRQIEKKIIKNFLGWNENYRLLSRISAERNGDEILTSVELLDYLGNHYDEIMYLLRNTNEPDVYYDKNTDSFIIGDESLSEAVNNYMESIPESFSEDDLDGIVKEGVEFYNLSEELLLNTIKENYNKTGTIWHRARITKIEMYSSVLKKYYENGIHIFDNKELNDFKTKLYEIYGDVEISQSYRALTARIANAGILAGRGIYKPRKESYISAELARRIEKFIDDYELPLVLFHSIFVKFEDELISEGVNNKDYLHGILKELFGNKYEFRRDYISKNGESDSFYFHIVNYIKQSKLPVSKNEIRNKFPGITEVMISIATSDSEVINLFGEYIHSNKLSFSDEDKRYLTNILNDYLKENGVIHSKQIYQHIKLEYSELLKNNYINYPFSLYSVLEYYFLEEYQFSRPFIASKNAEIIKPVILLKKYVDSKELIRVEDFKSFAKEKGLIINNTLDYIKMFSDTHLLINHNSFASYDYIGITESIANRIEKTIIEELDDKPIKITDLKSVVYFPRLKIEWNEWLIYSIINNWSDLLDVGVSSNLFMRGEPLIGLKGCSFDELVNGEAENNSIGTVDDLDDIDNLIMDDLELEW